MSTIEPSANPWRSRLAILLGAHAIGTMHSVSVLALAPVMRPELGLNFAEFGLLMTAYSAGQVSGSIPAGAFVERVGVGWALVGACVILTIGAALLTQAEGLTVALLALLTIGWGYSITNPATARGVLEWFPPNRRATAIGLKQTGVPVGGVLAAGTLAISAFLSWQTIIWLIAVATLCNAAICFTIAERPKRRSGASAGPLAGIVKVARDRNFGILVLASGLFNVGQYNFFTYLTSFMREAAQASQEIASLTLGLAQAVSAIGRIGWGAMSDMVFKGRRKNLAASVCMAAAIFFVGMAVAGWMAEAMIGIVVAVLLGLTIASYASLMQTMAVEAVPAEHSGSSIGYISIGTATGAMLGPPLFGAVIDATGRFADGWLMTGAIVASGVLLFAYGFRENPAKQHIR
ncbi:MAG: MFS transporter [Alphaproteobacteria bacterium]|nr:MFS transporter [Alphaproteobacteria bacterium]